jgi:hypothetical protein
LTRASTPSGGKKDVDGRDEPGHDERKHFRLIGQSLKMLEALSVRR